MMFKKKLLYDATQNVLKSGIELVNARAQALHEVLMLIETELAELKDKIESHKLLLDNKELLEANRNAIRDEFVNSIKRQVELQSLRDIQLKPFVKWLVECKEKILSIDNAKSSVTMSVINPFSEPFSNKKKCPNKFFSGDTFKQMETKDSAFEAANLNQRNLIAFRQKAVGALMVTIFAVSLASLIAASVALIVVNPVASMAMLGLMVAFSNYYLYKFSDYYTAWVESVTKINEKIDLGSLDESLFPELDRLIEFDNNQLHDSDSPEHERPSKKF